MTKDEFIQEYKDIYDLDDDDIEDQIIVLGNKKTEVDYLPITIDFCEKYCDIYLEFTYSDSDSLFTTKDTNEEQLLFMQKLGIAHGVPPELEYYDGMGCPFVDEQVGYFHIPYEREKIGSVLKSIEAVFSLYSTISTLDEEYLSKNFHDEYCTFLEYENDIKFAYRILLGHDPIVAASKFPDHFKADDEVYIDKQGTIIVGFGTDDLKKASNLIDTRMSKVSKTHLGLKYSFLSAGKLAIAIDADYINRIHKFLDIIKLEDPSSIEYSINQKAALLRTPFCDFWAIILPLAGNYDMFIIKERDIIQQLYSSLKDFMPIHLHNDEYDFSLLNNSEFEKLCRDLLVDMGFKNVLQRGTSTTIDGGIDIEADMVLETLFGQKKEHWIFQCKHT